MKPHTKVDRLLITLEVSKVKGFESKQRRDCQVQKIKVQKVIEKLRSKGLWIKAYGLKALRVGEPLAL